MDALIILIGILIGIMLFNGFVIVIAAKEMDKESKDETNRRVGPLYRKR